MNSLAFAKSGKFVIAGVGQVCLPSFVFHAHLNSSNLSFLSLDECALPTNLCLLHWGQLDYVYLMDCIRLLLCVFQQIGTIVQPLKISCVLIWFFALSYWNRNLD